MRRPLAGLGQHQEFLRLWSAATISVFGSMLSAIALPLVAILSLGAGPGELARLTIARMLPDALFALVAGGWTDRVQRRPLLIATDLARAVILLWIPVAAVMGWLGIGQLYLVALLMGLMTSIFDVAHHAFLPTLVERHELVEANAKLSGGAAVAEASAFASGGWLVQFLTAPFALVVDAVTFVASALLLWQIRGPELARPPRPAETVLLSEIAAGMRIVVRTRVLRTIGVGIVLRGFSYGIFLTLYMLFCVETLGFEPGFLGMIFAVGSVSSFLAAGLARRADTSLGSGRTMLLGYGLLAVGSVLIPLAPGATLVGAILLVGHQLIGDGGDTLFEISQTSLRQRIVPNDLLGRVTGSMRFGGSASMLVGALTAGALGERLGPRALFWVAALSVIAGALWLLRSSTVERGTV